MFNRHDRAFQHVAVWWYHILIFLTEHNVKVFAKKYRICYDQLGPFALHRASATPIAIHITRQCGVHNAACWASCRVSGYLLVRLYITESESILFLDNRYFSQDRSRPLPTADCNNTQWFVLDCPQSRAWPKQPFERSDSLNTINLFRRTPEQWHVTLHYCCIVSVLGGGYIPV